MNLMILVRALPVRRPKIAPTAAQATQLPQAAARAYVQSASHTRIITPARADISPAPAAPDIPNQEQHQGNVLAGKLPVLVISAKKKTRYMYWMAPSQTKKVNTVHSLAVVPFLYRAILHLAALLTDVFKTHPLNKKASYAICSEAFLFSRFIKIKFS